MKKAREKIVEELRVITSTPTGDTYFNIDWLIENYLKENKKEIRSKKLKRIF
jgi:hypothetical protein